MNTYGECPRCGKLSMEHLESYSHCWECNYSTEETEEASNWRAIEYRMPKIAAIRRTEEDRLLRGTGVPSEYHRHSRIAL